MPPRLRRWRARSRARGAKALAVRRPTSPMRAQVAALFARVDRELPPLAGGQQRRRGRPAGARRRDGRRACSACSPSMCSANFTAREAVRRISHQARRARWRDRLQHQLGGGAAGLAGAICRHRRPRARSTPFTVSLARKWPPRTCASTRSARHHRTDIPPPAACPKRAKQMARMVPCTAPAAGRWRGRSSGCCRTRPAHHRRDPRRERRALNAPRGRNGGGARAKPQAIHDLRGDTMHRLSPPLRTRRAAGWLRQRRPTR